MTGKIPYDEWKAQQPPEMRAAIDQEYLKLLQEEDDLRSLRLLLHRSQEELAERLGTTQGAVSKLERRSDMTLKNVRAIVKHLGGEVDIVVRFPGQRPIRLRKLSDASVPVDEDPPQPARFRKPREPKG